ERARTIVADHRAALDRLASALLERETLDRDEVELVVAGRPLPPVVPPPAPATPQPAPDGAATKEKTPARGPVLGSPPPEPAGAARPRARRPGAPGCRPRPCARRARGTAAGVGDCGPAGGARSSGHRRHPQRHTRFVLGWRAVRRGRSGHRPGGAADRGRLRA